MNNQENFKEGSSIKLYIVFVLIVTLIIGFLGYTAITDNNKKLICKKGNSNAKYELIFTFKDDKVVNYKAIYTINPKLSQDEFNKEESEIVLYAAFAQMAYEQIKDEDGVTYIVDEGKNRTTITIGLDSAKASKKVSEGLLSAYENETKDTMKKMMEEQGLTCK